VTDEGEKVKACKHSSHRWWESGKRCTFAYT
jgi:hypothetical protein